MKHYEGITLLAKRYSANKKITIKEAEERIKDVFNVMEQSLLDEANDGIQIIDFITLKKVVRKAKIGRNPLTKQEYSIPERLAIKTILGKRFDKNINK